MLTLWSPSSIAAHFVFCFTSCVVMLEFRSPSTAAHFAFCFTCCDQEWHREPLVKLIGCKRALNHPMVYFTDRSKAVVRCLSYSLLLCDLFHEAISFKSCLVLFCSCIFLSSFSSIAITPLGDERANLSAFCTFVRFALVLCFLFLFVSRMVCGL